MWASLAGEEPAFPRRLAAGPELCCDAAPVGASEPVREAPEGVGPPFSWRGPPAYVTLF